MKTTGKKPEQLRKQVTKEESTIEKTTTDEKESSYVDDKWEKFITHTVVYF